jgi:hypothetical protein
LAIDTLSSTFVEDIMKRAVAQRPFPAPRFGSGLLRFARNDGPGKSVPGTNFPFSPKAPKHQSTKASKAPDAVASIVRARPSPASNESGYAVHRIAIEGTVDAQPQPLWSFGALGETTRRQRMRRSASANASEGR